MNRKDKWNTIWDIRGKLLIIFHSQVLIYNWLIFKHIRQRLLIFLHHTSILIFFCLNWYIRFHLHFYLFSDFESDFNTKRSVSTYMFLEKGKGHLAYQWGLLIFLTPNVITFSIPYFHNQLLRHLRTKSILKNVFSEICNQVCYLYTFISNFCFYITFQN